MSQVTSPYTSARSVNGLTNRESLAFLSLVAKAHLIDSEEDFAFWCRNDLRPFLPFGIMLCAVGRLFGDMIVVDELQGVDYPASFVSQLTRQMALSERWVIQRWLRTREPQLIDHDIAASALSALEQDEFSTFGLEQIAAHGLITPDGLHASYFSFSRIKEGLTDTTALKLRMVVPHLHQVRTQIVWNNLRQTGGIHRASQLTPKELEVLRWVLQGKTNPQIAALLERSAQTVKHQVASVLGKLNAVNRAQAVSRALELGIVGMQSK